MRFSSAAFIALTCLAASIPAALSQGARPPGLEGAEHLEIRSRVVKAVSLDPADPAWKQAKSTRIPLLGQNFIPPFGGGTVKFVNVRSLHTPQDLYFAFSWPDKIPNWKSGISGKFLDGCSVMFPVKPGPPPSFMMGQKGGPVNIWLWKSVAPEEQRYDKAYSDFYRSGSIDTKVQHLKSVQNLVAEGFGTLTLVPQQDVEGKASWKNGTWTVVLRRHLKSPNGFSFQAGSIVPVAFAIWDGQAGERDGFKSLSMWHALVLETGGKVAQK